MPLCLAGYTITDVNDGANAVSYVIKATMTGTPDGTLTINVYEDGDLCSESIYLNIRSYDGSAWSVSPLSGITTTGVVSGGYTGTKAFEIGVWTDSGMTEMLASAYLSYGDTGDDGSSYIIANTPALSFTESNWKIYATAGNTSSWANVSNVSDMKIGDTVGIVGTISDLDNTSVIMLGKLTAVSGTTITILTNGTLIYGSKGAKGDPGDNAYTYWLEKSASVVYKNVNDGDALTPSSVTATAKINNSGVTSDFADGRIKVWAGVDTTQTPIAEDLETVTFTTSASVSVYLIVLYDSSAAELHRETIPVIENGLDAVQYYSFIKYATDSSGSDMSDVPTADTTFIGTYTGTDPDPAADEYSWSEYIGKTAEIQYAVGDSPTDPPEGVMQWNSVDMLWNSEEMAWNAVIYSDVVPVPGDGEYVWMRTRVGDGEWQYMRLTGEEGEDGEPAKVWTFQMSAVTYNIDHRRSDNNPAITLSADIQGYTVSPTWEVKDADNITRDSWLSSTSGATVTLTIPYDNSAKWPLSVNMKGTDMPTVTQKLTGVPTREGDFNFGSISSAPLPSYIDSPANTQSILEGDYFVAGATFSTAAWTVVTPSGSENPKTSGWYERTGTGTSSDPYVYTASNDTTVDSTKTYCTTTGTVYTKGVAYMYDGVSTWNAMTATTENAQRMLGALTTVLNDSSIQPSIGALYGWFKNLTALNAVIKHLTVGNLTIDKVMSNGKRFQFIAHAYDSNGSLLAIPEYDIIYDGTKMFSVDTEHGEISIDGNFKSNGFATSKSSSSTTPVTMSVSQLTEYYQISRWVEPVRAFAFRTGYTSFNLTSAQRSGILAAGIPQSLISSVGSTWYRQSSVTGTYRGQSFSGLNSPAASSRSMTAYLCAVVYNGQLWIGQCDDGVTYGYDDGWNTPDLGYHDFVYAPMSESSSATFEGETIPSSGYSFGYLLPSSYLTNKISAYTLPTGTDLEIESDTLGTISISGTTLDPATTDVYLNITATSLRVFNTTHNDYSDILNDATFYADRFYQTTDFAINNVDISTTKDGIKTMHIVPYADEQYDIGLSTNKYKNIYAEKVYGAVFN